jgi:tetratricopeptide (TPR) repeat protein
VDLARLIDECNLIVRQATEESSARALSLADAFVTRCQRMEARYRAIALRAQGWALLVAGKYQRAESAYLEARRLLRRDSLARARIDRVLIDVYMYRGNHGEAQRRARMAAATFRRLGAESDLAKTRVNFANVLHRQDRHSEAAERYGQAAAYFESQGEDVGAAICNYNLGNCLVQLFDFDRAEDLYTRAGKALADNGLQLRAVGCEYGLAWLYMLKGDFHIALQKLTQCERWYEQAGQERELLLCRLDRAEVYLGLNLFRDAHALASESEALARRLGVRYESAKAAFFLAKAAWAVGRRTEARRALKRAGEGFKAESNRPFLAAVMFSRSQMSKRAADRQSGIRAVRRQFARARLPLWEAICDLQILAADLNDSAAFNRLGNSPAVGAVPFLYAGWQTLAGDRYALEGDHDSAVAGWTRAAEALDAVRAKLPPVDMRTSFARQEINPFPRLVEHTGDRDPDTGAVWAERHRTMGVWAPIMERPTGNAALDRARESLNKLAGRICAYSPQLSTSEYRQGPPALGARSLQNEFDRVRHDLSMVEEHAAAASDEKREVKDLLAALPPGLPLIQFHIGHSDIIAFVHEGRQTRMRRLTDGVRTLQQYAAAWRFFVERQASNPEAWSAEDARDEQALLSRIGNWLWQPLDIASGRKSVCIVAEGLLCNLPWQALTANGTSLIEKHDIQLVPSVRHFARAAAVETRSRRMEVFVGDTSGLPTAESEIDFFRNRPEKNIEIHAEAGRDSWPTGTSARLWHFVGHARLSRDNPFYSALHMTDGPMFAADFRLKKNTVRLVTLAACQTGQQAHLPAEESTGLVRSFLEMGARGVIASHWSVWDQSSALWMKSFYSALFEGTSVADSVRTATLTVRDAYPAAYHWAAYSLYGAA